MNINRVSSIASIMMMMLSIMTSSMTAAFIMPHPSTSAVIVPRLFSSSADVTPQSQEEAVDSTDEQSSGSDDDFLDFEDDEQEGHFNPAKEAIIKSTKHELYSLSKLTKRGFDATRSQKQTARDLVDTLSSYNPTDEPASAYYAPDTDKSGETVSVPVYGIPTLEGKWTLVYTDAPDITNLDPLQGYGAFKLGRIGQECTPPFIKNVIEWTKPEWAKSLPDPFKLGNDEDRILQKVCCEGVATNEHPRVVDLKIVGLDLLGVGGGHLDEEAKDDDTTTTSTNDNDVVTKLREESTKLKEEGVAGYLEERGPVELRGPLKAPFGRFEILYLDDELRIIKTSQGYIAVNKRCGGESGVEEWF